MEHITLGKAHLVNWNRYKHVLHYNGSSLIALVILLLSLLLLFFVIINLSSLINITIIINMQILRLLKLLSSVPFNQCLVFSNYQIRFVYSIVKIIFCAKLKYSTGFLYTSHDSKF